MTEKILEQPVSDEFEHKEADAEWWYFDGQNESGVVFNMIFYSHLGNNKPTFSLFLQSPGEKPVAIHEQMDTEFSSDSEQYLTMGDHQAQKEDDRIELSSKGKNYQIDLSFKPVYKPNKLGIIVPGMGWRVEMPKATVKGKITINDKEIPFNGIGYHDHNWFKDSSIIPEMNNREVLAKVLKGWQFGRFFGSKTDIVYGFNKTESHVILNGTQVPNAVNTVKTEHFERFDFDYDARIEIETPQGLIEINNSRIISSNALVESGDKVNDGYLRFLSDATMGDENMKGVNEVWT